MLFVLYLFAQQLAAFYASLGIHIDPMALFQMLYSEWFINMLFGIR